MLGGARAIATGPSAQPRGSISGTITDEANAPIARASVCARTDEWQLPSAIAQPVCVASDDRGQYKIANLVAADYALLAGAPRSVRRVSAGARLAQPRLRARRRRGQDRRRRRVAARRQGETKTGVELSLETLATVTGRLVDQTHKPIPRVRMFGRRANAGPLSGLDTINLASETITDE